MSIKDRFQQAMLALASTVLALTCVLVADAHPADAAGTKPVVLTFAAKLTNISNNTQSYGDLQYGTTELVGASLVNGEEVKVIRNSSLLYENGSGPIGGFLTVLWPDGSRISMQVDGTAKSQADQADFVGTLTTFSTAGRWAGYQGTGRMRAHRAGPLGSPITYVYRVKLTK